MGLPRFVLLVCLLVASRAQAEIPDRTLRLGVLTDMSGPFADQTGAGSVLAARLAAEDFAPESRGLAVDIRAADHQNRPDIGAGIARAWVDQDGVDAIVDLPNSGVALAVAALLRARDRTALASGSMSSDLTGAACAPTTVQWMSDTWAQGRATVDAMLQQGLRRWYFVTVDYALGQTLERDATESLLAGGGQVLGSTRHPLGTADFAGPLLAAASSGADVVALADTGTDAINAVKQAAEFGLAGRVHLAALFMMLSDVHALGLQAAQGLMLASGFYWDTNDATRAWSQRFAARMGGRMPTEAQASVYSATLAWLRAARDADTVAGAQVVAAMRRAPFVDTLFGQVSIRSDGRVLHEMSLFRVKAPAASDGPWDLYARVATIPAGQAFRPQEGSCRF